jgi:hypothetical protein
LYLPLFALPLVSYSFSLVDDVTPSELAKIFSSLPERVGQLKKRKNNSSSSSSSSSLEKKEKVVKKGRKGGLE